MGSEDDDGWANKCGKADILFGMRFPLLPGLGGKITLLHLR